MSDQHFSKKNSINFHSFLLFIYSFIYFLRGHCQWGGGLGLVEEI